MEHTCVDENWRRNATVFLDAARRRGELFAIDDHWRQGLLLMVAWLAPPSCRDPARRLVEEMQAQVGPEQTLNDLVSWIRADLWGEVAPTFAYPEPPQEGAAPPRQADPALIEELLKRVGGGQYSRELIRSQGLDASAQNPDAPPPTRGLYREMLRRKIPGQAEEDLDEDRTTTRYLAELDGPYLVAHAARDMAQGTQALDRYLSVYTNYSYPEYRFSTLWLLLGFIVRLPRSDGGVWVRDAALRVLDSALGGTSVEFEQGLAVAVTALRAQAPDPAARTALVQQAHQLMGEAMRLKPGRNHDGSDIWAHHKRAMLATAQALGWLLGEQSLAGQVLSEALALADSGFAGYQAPACLAMAEAFWVCAEGGPQFAAQIEQSLAWAQNAAHNVQDPTFCARMTARVNAMRRHWWPAAGAAGAVQLDDRARSLADAAYRPELNALHRVGHAYTGRRDDALALPPWATHVGTFDALERLYQRSRADFLRLNGADRPLVKGDDVAVPDPGLVPHLAARLAAEVLAQAGHNPLPPERLKLLRTLVPFAAISPTALDAVLTRLVLAQGRRGSPVELAEVEALQGVLRRRPMTPSDGPTGELLVTGVPGRLPA